MTKPSTPQGRQRKPTRSAVARHGRFRQPKIWGVLFAYVALGVTVVLVATITVSAFAVLDVTTSVEAGIELESEPPGPEALKGGFNIMVVGSDARAGQASAAGEDDDGVLNDVNMLIHVSADHTRITVLSLPRDMIVPIADCRSGGGGYNGPMNVILDEGGLPCVVSTVEALTGLDIPYAMLVGFDGVVDLANVVGGVDVCVAKDIEDDYQNVYLKAGMHTLSGAEAIHFLRVRYGIGDGSDIGRISSQQAFLSSLLRKVTASNVLSNPVTLYNMAKAVAKDVKLSTSMNNVDVLVSMAVAIKNVPLNSITFVQFPGTPGEGELAEKLIPDYAAAQVLLTALKADAPIQLTTGTGRGTILSTPTATPTPTPTTSADGTTATPSPTATPVVLPQDITGQTASQVACTVGRSLAEQ